MRNALLALAVSFLALALPSFAGSKEWAPILAYEQKSSPTEVHALVEIPARSFTKYEIDAKTGFLIVDRFQTMPVAYPANYGSVTATLAGDGDPLDVLIYTREPVVPGALIKVRPIGVLRMIDGGETDDKIVAVPASKVDPTYDAVRDIADLPAAERDRLVAFFRVYKQLPSGSKVVELGALDGAQAAREVVGAAVAAYAAQAQRR